MAKWQVIDTLPEGKWDVVWTGPTRHAAQDVVALLGPGHVIMTECDAGVRNPNALCRYHGKRHGEA